MHGYGYGSGRAGRRPAATTAPLRALRPLAFRPATVSAGTATSGTIDGAAPDSDLAAGSPPLGFSIDTTARTWRFDGSGGARTVSVALTETLAGAANNPRRTTVTLEVAAAAASTAPVLLAILAGQSNMEGRFDRDGAVDGDVAGAVQFIGDPQAAGYRTLSSDITPLLHQSTTSDIGTTGSLGPGEYIARRLLADNEGATVVLVPVARGSTRLVAAPQEWRSDAVEGQGGYLFENMVQQANLAHVAAAAAYPGRPILPLLFWSQGEFDASGGTTREQYAAALRDLIDRARARIAGASTAAVVIGSMVPEKWSPISPNRDAGYVGINAAHVALSLSVAGVRYARGPDYTDGQRDFLHYQPAQRIRDYGAAMAAALSDTAGPAMTSRSTAGTSAGAPLALALTSDDAHATFAIDGGAAAAQFEVSDPYLTPTLRWAGDGAGPDAGTYRVTVQARDGAGNLGPDQTIAVTVANAYGQGDQGEVTVRFTGTARDGNVYFGNPTIVIPAVPLGVGLNLVLFSQGAGNASVTAVTAPGGIAGVPLIGRNPGDGSDGIVFGLVSSLAGTFDLAVSASGGNGAAGNLALTIVTLTGTKAAPDATDLAVAYAQPPVVGASLACPAGGIVVGLGRIGNPGAPGAGCTMVGTGDGGFAASRATAGAISVQGDPGYYFIASLAFAKSA